MRIGELSKRSGISVRMLRYFEKHGLLAPQRHSQGYRAYTDADLQLVTRVKSLRAAGLSFRKVKALWPCVQGLKTGFIACPQLQAELMKEVEALDARIEDLRASRALLGSYAAIVDASLRRRTATARQAHADAGPTPRSPAWRRRSRRGRASSVRS